MRKTAYKPGKVIVKEGDIGDNAYIVMEGRVEVFRTTEEGTEIILAKLTEGQMFGELALIDEGTKRTASVRTVTNCIIAVITRESFEDKLQKTPVSIKSMLKVLANRVTDTSNLLMKTHSKIDFLVKERIDDIIQENNLLKDQLRQKDNQVESLEDEILELKKELQKHIAMLRSKDQKIDKERSMKISMKTFKQDTNT